MYYIYGLIDPRNNEPFYIGKGQGSRCLDHFKNTNREINTPKRAKIKKLKSLGFDPLIKIYVENIENEKIAYDIEEKIILQYGRKNYDKDGILTNICLGSNPPNFKGKTYKEIYGDKYIEIIEKKRLLQLEAGGYGPKKHSKEAKLKMSIKASGKNNARYGAKIRGTDIAKKISISNTGKKHHTRWILYYIENIKTHEHWLVYSVDLEKFCKKYNFSKGTLHAQLASSRSPPTRGKTINIAIRKATEVEVSSYLTGGINRDIDETTFKGFTL